MATRRELVKRTSAKKGFFALAGLVGSSVLFWKTGWIPGAVGVVGTLWLTWDWFKFRAINGLRFK